MLLFNFLLSATICWSSTYSAKILGVFHAPCYSHHVLGEVLMKELAGRGHEVTMIRPYSQKIPLENFRDVNVPEVLEILNNTMLMDLVNSSPITATQFTHTLLTNITEVTLASKSVQKLLHSNESFDLVILEYFLNDAHQGFAHHFKAPAIVLSTVGSSSLTNRLVGNLALPSYVPDVYTNFSPKMNFIDRMLNLFYMIFLRLYSYFVYFPKQNDILHRYFPNSPHIYDLIYNTSLVFLNSHVSYNAPLAYPPNMIEIGGFHIQPPTQLPKDLKTFLDDGKEGVIYFSMGSVLRSEQFPSEKRDAIMKSFSKLKMRVLWKWESDNLPGQASNVRIEKWLPQQAVLAHPNVVLFITHGGRMSTIETVYHGVPVIGIPFFADQKMNVAEVSYLGYGILLPYKDLTEQTFDAALKEITENPKYTENVKRRSHLLRIQPVKPIDRAMYWIEYVLDNKGAPHLRSAGMDLYWYQYFLLDVFLFLTLVIVSLFKIFFFIVRRLRGRKPQPKQKHN